jgi:hypothetical protein
MRSAHVLAGSLLAALASLASAQSQGDERAAREYVATVAKIAAGFVAFAGSEDNAVALVESLREGVAVNLTFPQAGPAEEVPNVVTLDPPTGPMEWNDVRMALMLARDALIGIGISRPAGEQLHAVMLGGEIITPAGKPVAFRGVLQMRAEGLNWGRIASERYQRPAISRVE